MYRIPAARSVRGQPERQPGKLTRTWTQAEDDKTVETPQRKSTAKEVSAAARLFYPTSAFFIRRCGRLRCVRSHNSSCCQWSWNHDDHELEELAACQTVMPRTEFCRPTRRRMRYVFCFQSCIGV
eukprot:2926288-Rhodomonas_salina.1